MGEKRRVVEEKVRNIGRECVSLKFPLAERATTPKEKKKTLRKQKKQHYIGKKRSKRIGEMPKT